MKAGMLLGVVMAILASSALAAESMKEEPADFRGVKWSEAFANVGDQMVLVRDEGDVKYYRRNGDPLKFGHIDAIKVAYRFYKGNFSSGVIQTYGGANQKDLLSALSRTHGDPVRPRKRIPQYFWDGQTAFMVLTCEVTSYCIVEISSKDVIQREQTATGVVPSAQKKDDD
jgi:hypothetical protein